MATNQWTKVGEGMRRNNTSRTIYAKFRFKGKIICFSLDTKDKTVARNKLAEHRKALENGPVRNEENTIISEASPRFLASLSGLSKSSQVRAKGHMKYVVAEFGDRNPRELKPMDLDEWLQELREEHEFGEDCWNKYCATLEQFYAFLIANCFALENPAKSLDFLKAKAVRKVTPSTEQVQAILEHIRTKTFFPEKQETVDFIEFLALTGQGKAEALHAQWQDIFYAEKKVLFYRQKTRADAHTMPLFPSIAAFLTRRLNGRIPEPHEPIFKIKSAKNALGSACEKLGFPRFQHHAFRRYFITQRLMEGVPPNIVAKWVGHRTTEMVMEIYASIPNNYEVSFAEKIPALTLVAA
jgi:integrase